MTFLLKHSAACCGSGHRVLAKTGRFLYIVCATIVALIS